MAEDNDQTKAQNADAPQSREYGWWAFFVEIIGNVIRAVLKIF